MLKKHPALLFILVASILAVYSNVYDMQFVYDDEFYIQKNQYLNSWSNVDKILLSNSTAGAGFQDSFYRPLQFFLYLVVSQIIGQEPWGFHALNVFIHLLNTLLVFFLVLELGVTRRLAFFVALLWGLHPVHVEVIAYMSGTADPLHALFCLSALLVLLKKPRFYLAVSCLLFIGGLLTKEVAVVFPGLAFAVLFITQKDRWNWRSYGPVALYLSIALCYVGLRATLLNFNGDFEFYKTENLYTQSLWVRVLTFLATLPDYLKLLLWPRGLHIDRAFSIQTEFLNPKVLTGLLMIFAAAGTLVFAYLKRKDALIMAAGGVLWFAAAHSLHSGVLLPMNSFFLEHWLYLPSLSFFVLTLSAANRFLPEKVWASVSVLIAILLATATYQQNRMWESPITLFSRILQYNPTVSRVRHNLAMAYSDQGDDEKAQLEYELILKYDQQPYPQTYHNLALIHLRRNNFEEGEKLLLKALSVSPRFYPSYDYLIQIYQVQGKTEKAEEWKRKKKQNVL